jgi:hypothetical protein
LEAASTGWGDEGAAVGDPTYGAAEPSACGPSVERSPEISGSGAAGGAGEEERRVEGDAALWGRGNREREGKERGC